MNIKIQEMHIMINMKLKAFFAVVLDDSVRLYGFKLFQSNEGEYSIEPPFERYVDKVTKQTKTARHIHLHNDIKKAIMDRAVETFIIENKKLINEVIARKASKEV